MAAELGMLDGIDGAGRFAHRWDPREDFRGGAIDLGWCGEDERGIWLSRHPIAALVSMPELFDALDEFRRGLWDLTPLELAEKSYFELECRQTLVMAHRREEARRMKRGGDG